MREVNKKRNVAYLIIGVLTLMLAITGATYAYFTATDSAGEGTITGNMASIQLDLSVEKVVKVDDNVDGTNGADANESHSQGLIPMSNGMVERAVNSSDTANNVCMDDNDNPVCQIFKITLKNDSSAVQFVDGYVSLRYGSRTPTDYTNYVAGAKFNNKSKAADATNGVGTTMRWAQVFPGSGTNDATRSYSTGGDQILGTASEKVTFTQIGADLASASDTPAQALAKAHNTKHIRDSFTTAADTEGNKGILSTLSIAGTTYDVIGRNYVRVSNHNWGNVSSTGSQTYTRTADPTSALVINHSIQPNTTVIYYIVTWLSETGTNQDPISNDDHDTASAAAGIIPETTQNFFDGNVTFVSAQGSEVSATFSEYLRVTSDNA